MKQDSRSDTSQCPFLPSQRDPTNSFDQRTLLDRSDQEWAKRATKHQQAERTLNLMTCSVAVAVWVTSLFRAVRQVTWVLLPGCLVEVELSSPVSPFTRRIAVY